MTGSDLKGSLSGPIYLDNVESASEGLQAVKERLEMKEPDTIISISPAEFNKIPLFKSLNYEDLEDILFKCALLRIDEGSVVIAPGAPRARPRSTPLREAPRRDG